MGTLIEKIRRAREQRVQLGAHTFVVRRPTDLEMALCGGELTAETMIRYVVGWEGVKEADIVAGGDPHPVPFDAAVCAEWMADRVDLLLDISRAIRDLYTEHRARQEAAAKN